MQDKRDLIQRIEQERQDRSILRENARLASVLENLALGLFLVNREGKITEVNVALANLLDVEEEGLIACGYQDLFARIVSLALEPDVVQMWLNSAVMRLLERPRVEFTIQHRGINHIELSLFPLWDEQGQSLGWGGLLQDITELREQTSWKLELLSILSHDIRTPLATLKGHATALLANYRRWSDDMILEFLETIDRGVDDLVHQVDRNLALTRVESGHLGLRPEAVDVKSIVQQSLERSGGVLRDHQVIVELPESLPQVRVDPARTEEVLMNLLENAVRYNRTGQPITIRVRPEASMVWFSVSDHGPGIAPEKRKTIFDKYVRSQNEGGGTGLGLFISRKIVEAQGGRIWVESPPRSADTGAEFVFTVPMMPGSMEAGNLEKRESARGAQRAHEKSARGERVLVVEDEADVQALLHTILVQEGYRVEVAPDGRTAIEILQALPVDIVLLDWVLPAMDGISVCRNMRRWSNVPVIVVTSKIAQEDLIAALDAGADDYVTKPFRGEELLARMRALLRRGERREREEVQSEFRMDGLIIHFESREVWANGKLLDLTPTEYDLLVYLVRHRRQVLTYDQLIEALWGGDGEGTRHSLFVHISRLRNKIEADPKDPRFIQTRWGVGYSFMSE